MCVFSIVKVKELWGYYFVFVFVLWLVSWLRAPVDIMFCSLFGVLISDSFPKSFLSVRIHVEYKTWLVFSDLERSCL